MTVLCRICGVVGTDPEGELIPSEGSVADRGTAGRPTVFGGPAKEPGLKSRPGTVLGRREAAGAEPNWLAGRELAKLTRLC